MEDYQMSLFDEDSRMLGTLKETSIKEISGDKSVKIKSIISASRRTDIPAFYYDWLQSSLQHGNVEIPNPIYQNKTYHVDLRPESVHSIVLWSKDFSNVIEEPGYLNNYNLYFQYTVNHYSKLLEPRVPEYKHTLRVIEGLLKRYHPRQFNIRFDPIIISQRGEISPTPDKPDYARLLVFEQLCKDIRALGMEECRVTTSYLALYGHVLRCLEHSDIDILHLNEENQIIFFSQMVQIADQYGITLYSCASPVLERVEGMKIGHCIDGELLEQLFGGRVKKSKDTGQRKACGCTVSREIGIYSRSENGMKCLHGCSYCYIMGKEAHL